MNKGLKYGISTIILAVMLLGLGCVLMSVARKRDMTTCTGMDVVMKDTLKFISADDVEALVKKHYGTFLGKQIDSIDLARVEEVLDKSQVILKSEAWTSHDGVLHVSVQQRKPVIRFRKENGKILYTDAEGFVFSASGDYTANVPLVTGNIPSIEDGNHSEWLGSVIEMVTILESSPRWKGFFKSIKIAGNGDFVMTPVVGKERIIMGQPHDVKEKLQKLEKYYTHIKPSEQGDNYKSVNLKYNKQLICRKDI